MQAAPPVDTVIQAVQTLYHNPDVAEKERASTWLGDFQRSIYAWQISDELLQRKQDVESCYIAAQTMRTKIQYSFHELPVESHESLRNSLINHIEVLSDPNFQVIMTQLCLALADLALQMPQWRNSASFLIQKFSSNQTHVPILLEILIVLPEEIHSRSLRLGQNRREEFSQELTESAPAVLNLLTACSETYQNDHRILGRVFKCLASWFYLQSLPTREVAGSKILTVNFQVLMNHNTPSMLHEAASDNVVAALYSMEDIEEHPELAHALYQGVMQLHEAYHMAVAEEDIDKCVNYSRIFTELAEAFLEVMVESPGRNLGDLRILGAVLDCVGHCQYEVAEITFNFWYRMSEILYKRDSQILNDVFRPYIHRLITALAGHCQLDPDHEGIPDEHDEFGDFRMRVSDLVKDVVYLVGSTTCFEQMFNNLASHQGGASWEITEAALFTMTAVAKNILPEENGVVPHVLQAIINLPPSTHVAVKYTSTRMLGQLAEWIEKHPDYLEPILSFLTDNLRIDSLASVAATSLMNLCSTCQDPMRKHFDGLLQIVQAMDSFNLSHEAGVGLLRGSAMVLSKMPLDKICEGLKQLVYVQITPLSQSLKSGEVVKSGAKGDPTIWLDRLAEIFRHTNPLVMNGEAHPCQPLIQDIWPILSSACERYQADVKIIERCCRCLRFAIRCVGMGSVVLLNPLVTQMVNIYRVHQHSCFLYLGSILVDEYGKDEGCIAGLLEMLQAFIVPAFQLLQGENGLRDHPDTVDDLFRLCARFVQRNPLAILGSSVMQSVLECAIFAITLAHREANASVMKFFRDLIHCATEKQDKDDFETRVTLVKPLLFSHGEEITKGIITACVFHLPSFMVPDQGDVLFLLMKLDRAAVCTWLETTLKSLPTQNSVGTVNATQKQLTDFHKAVTKSENQKEIIYALRDFARLFR
ncbi:transportin-3-like [Anneissia japonica]|uniref:transportin-3-like n=1 Tax=Anneissia japonica TaxID=1529436 RepID=UPI00142565A8|nr:transportin-3-like [Anneissia japonica]